MSQPVASYKRPGKDKHLNEPAFWRWRRRKQEDKAGLGERDILNVRLDSRNISHYSGVAIVISPVHDIAAPSGVYHQAGSRASKVVKVR
jgi:hypothetical protein